MRDDWGKLMIPLARAHQAGLQLQLIRMGSNNNHKGLRALPRGGHGPQGASDDGE